MITDFSLYLKDDGVLDLNIEGNKLSGEKGKIRCFKDTFDVRKLVEFIKTTPGVKGFKAVNWDIGKMDIDNFRLLINAIKKSEITDLNLAENTLPLEMVGEISKLNKLSKLNLGGCDIDDEKITKIVEKLCNIATLNVEDNYITDIGVGAIAKHLPDLLALYASCNSITDIGADEIAKGFKKIEILIFPAFNNISYGGIKGVVIAHSDTLTVFDAGFCGCSKKLQVWELGNLLPNCVFKLGPYWTRGVNDNNEASVNLDGVVWGNLLPVDHVEVVEGDNNAPALVGVVGENNNALPPVEHVGVVGDILEG